MTSRQKMFNGAVINHRTLGRLTVRVTPLDNVIGHTERWEVLGADGKPAQPSTYSERALHFMLKRLWRWNPTYTFETMNANRIVIKLLEDAMGPLGNGDGAGTPEPPEPQGEQRPTISIGTIFNALPPGVDEQIMAILNGVNDTIEMAKQLKVLLRQHEAALDSIGLIPDYTAYMLTAVAQQQRGIP